MNGSNSDSSAAGEPSLTRETASAILNLVQSAPDIFMGSSGTKNHMGTVYGGTMLAQALYAAVQTVDAVPLTSLHAYFLAPGRTDLPLEYRVVRLRDSRRFVNRQVTLHQDGQAIFSLMCEFHAPEQGFTHRFAPMPIVPDPEAVASVQDFVREHEAALDAAVVRNYAGALPIEMRPIAPETYLLGRPEQPVRDFWFRLPSASSFADPRAQHCLLAFASDYWFNGVSASLHVTPTNSDTFLLSSLDHAQWFHRPVRCEEWLLHHTVSPLAADGLGFTVGQIFDREGNLIASTAQECLLRRLDN